MESEKRDLIHALIQFHIATDNEVLRVFSEYLYRFLGRYSDPDIVRGMTQAIRILATSEVPEIKGFRRRLNALGQPTPNISFINEKIFDEQREFITLIVDLFEQIPECKRISSEIEERIAPQHTRLVRMLFLHTLPFLQPFIDEAGFVGKVHGVPMTGFVNTRKASAIINIGTFEIEVSMNSLRVIHIPEFEKTMNLLQGLAQGEEETVIVSGITLN